MSNVQNQKSKIGIHCTNLYEYPMSDIKKKSKVDIHCTNICECPMSNIKLAFLSSLKGHLYFARALQLGNLKVYGKLLKGHQGQDQGNGGICLHVTQAMINTAYIICSNKVIIVESLCPHLMSR